MRKLISESTAVYPKIRLWTHNILKDRSQHHGYTHSQDVRRLARKLAKTDGILSPRAYPLMDTIAILHDVDDPKCDPDGAYKRRLDWMLCQYTSRTLRSFIIDAKERISLSNETAQRKKYIAGIHDAPPYFDWSRHSANTTDWDVVLSPGGTLIRHYVSDADKLLSLGARGHTRIVEYNCEKLRLSLSTLDSKSLETLCKEIEHVIDWRMKPLGQYIRTPAGKLLTPILLDQLLSAHEKWRVSIGVDRLWSV